MEKRGDGEQQEGTNEKEIEWTTAKIPHLMKPHNLLNRTQRIEKFRSAESVLQTPYLFKFNKIDLFFRFPVLSFDSIRLMLDIDECMYVWTNVCMCFADTDGYLVVLSIVFAKEISFPLSFYLSRLLPMICVLFQHFEEALLPINESLSPAHSISHSLSSQSHEFIFEILKSLLDGEHWRRIEIRI